MTPRRGAAGLLWALGTLPVASAAAQEAPAAPIEITVTQARPLTAPTPRSVVGAEEGRRGAGTQGDAVKALQTMPGLARAGAGGGEIIAWGSAPRETGLYVDGVPIPTLYHGSGVRSVLPSGWVARLELTPGAYGAEYGRGLGGVVAIDTRPLDTERWHAGAHADLLDLGLSLSIAPADGVAIAAAARQGIADRWLPALTDADVGSLMRVPRYRDGQLALQADLSEHERLTWSAFGSSDDFRYETPSSDPALRSRDDRRLDFWRSALRYVRDDADARVEATAFVGRDVDRRELSASRGRSGRSRESLVYGVRASERRRWGNAALRLGVDALGTRSRVRREGTLALPGREGDPLALGQVPGPDVAVDAFEVDAIDVAPHAELSLAFGGWTLSPGLRLDTLLLETDRILPVRGRLPPVGQSRATLSPEPRLGLSYELGAVRWLAAAGLYHQAPDAEDLSPNFGNPELRVARSLQLLLGEEVALSRWLELSLLGFYKALDRLATRSDRSTPDTARVLDDGGRGRSYGAQLLLRHSLRAGWSGWLAWTVSRSERWQGTSHERLFDQDQPHVLFAVVNKRTERWSFGARLRYASGAPRTPVIGASYDLLADRHEPVFGPLNSRRLPDFFQLDLRLDRRFAIGAWSLSLYADALNVTARENAEEIVYGTDYRESGYLLGLPPMLVLGARLEK